VQRKPQLRSARFNNSRSALIGSVQSSVARNWTMKVDFSTGVIIVLVLNGTLLGAEIFDPKLDQVQRHISTGATLLAR
jgi:hypothetical protein